MDKSKQLLNKAISDDREIRQNPYAHLNGAGDFDALLVKRSANEALSQNINKPRKSSNPYAWIEKDVRKLHRDLWSKRHELWPEGVPSDPIKLLDPAVAIRYLGFEFEQLDYLGEYYTNNKKSDTAGIIDRNANKISISNRLPYITHLFTSAHELGHAVLHKQAIMHRDIPMDSPDQKNIASEPMETEANKFATYFLMPEKLVRERFINIFFTDTFTLNDDTAYALDPTNAVELMKQPKSPIDLARLLAKTEFYNGNYVNSLAKQFSVSIEAMAIRILELKLIKK